MFTALIFALLLLGVFWIARHRRKLAMGSLLSSLVLFFLSAYGILPAVLLHYLETPEMFLSEPLWGEKNAIVLLGGGTVEQPGTDHILPSPGAYSRIYEAARLYFACEQKAQRCIIITAGADVTGTGQTEAAAYREALLDIGVKNADILLEPKSRNTFQNAQFTRAIIQKEKPDQIFLVTSDIHMKRAKLFFDYFKINPVPAASTHEEPIVSLEPSSFNLALSDMAMHEYMGIAQFYWYNLMGWNTQPNSEITQ